MGRQARRWAWLVLVVLVWTLSGAAGVAAGDRGELTAGHKRMLDWCGEFDITGKTFASPFGPARQIKARWIGMPILDGFAIEGTYFYEGQGPSGETQAKEIVSYDPATNTYHYVFLCNNGYCEQAYFTDQDGVAAWEGTVVIDGKELRFRGRDTGLPDGTGFLRTVEFSTDGQTWQPNMECRHIKVTPTSDEQELLRLQQEWCRAEVAGDVRTVDRLLADEYVLTLSDGTLMPKAAYLRDIQSKDTRSVAMSVEGTKVRLYGDMALVKGIVKWTEPGGKRHENLFSETWLKRDGRWQCLATHQSEIGPTIDVAQLSDEMKKLEVFVGKWEYEGEQVDPPVAGLPFGGAGAFSGTLAHRFVLGGRFLEGKTEDHNPAGTTTSVELQGYDPKAKSYVSSTFDSEGSTATSLQTVSPDGRTWTARSTMTTSAGDKVPVRSVTTFSPDGMRYKGTTEVSPDGGQTWKHWFSFKGTKAAN